MPEYTIKVDNELACRLTQLYNRPELNYKTMEDLIVDLIDDVVDVWLDADLNEIQEVDAQREAREG